MKIEVKTDREAIAPTIKINIICKILCKLGFHNWIYHTEDFRVCKKCGKEEIVLQ